MPSKKKKKGTGKVKQSDSSRSVKTSLSASKSEKVDATGDSGIQPRLLVLDDDPVFCKLMSRVADIQKIPVTVCGSINELQSLSQDSVFDVAVIDYYLDDFDITGADIAHVLGSTPVVLMSRSDQCVEENMDWPPSIRRFVNKSQGVDTILRTAVNLSKNLTH